MDRRRFIQTAVALPAAAAGFSSLNSVAQVVSAPADRWRIFEVTSRVEILKPNGVTRVWLPVPLSGDTPYQKSLGNTWNAEGGKATLQQDAKYGAGFVSAEWDAGVQKPVLQVKSRFATRDFAVDLTRAGQAPREDRATLALYTSATELLPTDGIVRQTAREITKGKRSDVDKARAIYEWIVDNTFRNPDTRGCGVGDIKAMLEGGNLGGKCADLNALFVGLARSVGIPARDVYGIRVAKSEYGYRSLGVGTDNITRAQHCRAEFYAQGFGWVPVDPADVRKVVLEEKQPAKLPLTDEQVVKARERLFGSWEMNWLAYNYAHDLSLPGSSRKVSFLMYPQCETAEGRLDELDPDNFRYQLTAREIAV